MIQVGFFGVLGELVGREVSLPLSVETQTIGHLRAALSATYPQAGTLLTSPRVKAFAHDVQVSDDTSLAGVTRVEFLPPVSGG